MKVIKYLGHGIGRVVCELENNIVVKVPFNSNWIKQNKSEYERYQEDKGKYYAKVVDYDTEKDWLYMEKVEDVSEYFRDYQRDNIHCKVYDDVKESFRKCECNGKCYQCENNILKTLLPDNVDDIIAHKPKDRLQIGLTQEGKYKYFDYSDINELENNDLRFYDSNSDIIVDYLTEEPEITFEEYLRSNNITQGFDFRLSYKNIRINWSNWNNRKWAVFTAFFIYLI